LLTPPHTHERGRLFFPPPPLSFFFTKWCILSMLQQGNVCRLVFRRLHERKKEGGWDLCRAPWFVCLSRSHHPKVVLLAEHCHFAT
jgi:hypothetical protein